MTVQEGMSQGHGFISKQKPAPNSSWWDQRGHASKRDFRSPAGVGTEGATRVWPSSLGPCCQTLRENREGKTEQRPEQM